MQKIWKLRPKFCAARQKILDNINVREYQVVPYLTKTGDPKLDITTIVHAK